MTEGGEREIVGTSKEVRDDVGEKSFHCAYDGDYSKTLLFGIYLGMRFERGLTCK